MLSTSYKLNSVPIINIDRKANVTIIYMVMLSRNNTINILLLSSVQIIYKISIVCVRESWEFYQRYITVIIPCMCKYARRYTVGKSSRCCDKLVVFYFFRFLTKYLPLLSFFILQKFPHLFFSLHIKWQES